MRRSAEVMLALAIAIGVAACGKQGGEQAPVEGQQLPDETVMEFKTQETDSGRVRWTLKAPRADRFNAKNVFVMMEHLTKTGESKIVPRCTYPITGLACVTRIYTDLAVIDVTPEGPVVTDIVAGLPFAELERLTGVPLRRLQV